eukprot:TRINITY_DN1603_c0_g1_i3.p1 TRINITY_DN1603_c0_g1~~TRINITY_DN1603_c0_g1_i3.p1  ORF type:complete len:329 (-),score=110.85 TRINITY_DN1603_c0_g1_i3:585-1571(-)
MSTDEESDEALREAPGVELDGKRITVEIARGDKREDRKEERRERDRPPPSRDDFRCYNCGGRGHLARDCAEKPRNPMYADTRGTKLGGDDRDRGRYHPYGSSRSGDRRDDRRDLDRRDDDRDFRDDRGRDWDPRMERRDGGSSRGVDRYDDRGPIPYGSSMDQRGGDPYYPMNGGPSRSSYGPPPGYPPLPSRRYSPPPSYGPVGVRGGEPRSSRPPYDDYYDRRVGPGSDLVGPSSRRDRSPERGMGYPPRDIIVPLRGYASGPPMDDYARRGRSPERPPYYGARPGNGVRSSSPDRYNSSSSRSGGQLAALEAQRAGGRARTPDRF